MTTTERIANRRTAALYIAVVMSCEFITFYSLPSALPFSVNPTPVPHPRPITIAPAAPASSSYTTATPTRTS